MVAACMITPEAVVGPRIDLAVDDLIKLAGERAILRERAGSRCQAQDNDR
jgi:hypothetical protein